MSQLVEIGFANRDENLRLLRKNGGDVNKVRLVFRKCCGLVLDLDDLNWQGATFFLNKVS